MSTRSLRGLLRAALLGAAVAVLVVSTACGTEFVAEPERTPTSQAPLDAEGPDPVAISIPKLDAYSTLGGASGTVGLTEAGKLAVPPEDQPMQAAWYAGRDPEFPGDEWDPGEVGPAIIVGHVNGRIDGRSGQPGIFARLRELAPGDQIVIERDRADAVTFVVTALERVPKDEFPWDRVMAQTAEPELRLITCGGDFNRRTGHYEDNWIVWAHEAPAT